MSRNTELYNRRPTSDCVPQETVIEDVRLAMAYVPFQKNVQSIPSN
jgi:hypothetical protein